MGYWENPNCFKHQNFIEIPEGYHRVKIYNVDVEEFNEGKMCFEITLDVSGCHGKLYYYLWFDPAKQPQCAKKFMSFFRSFNIRDYKLRNYKDWKGKCGGVRVRHKIDEYTKEVQVLYCLNGVARKMLPPWRDAPELSDKGN